MAQYGTTKRVSRAKVPMQVLRGFSPTEPHKLSSLAAPIDDEAIKSGMVMVKATGLVDGVSTDGAFRKAIAADALTSASEGTSFFIALHDQDGHDVQASGGLVGLDCSDVYEVQTGYFDKSVSYSIDDPLVIDDNGVLTNHTGVTTGEYEVIGYVTAVGGGTGNSIAYVGKTPSTATAADAEVLQFKTARNGQSITVA